MSIILEDKQLANDILERHYYQNFRDPSKFNQEKNLEIFLTGACKSNCEYCYLKNNHILYPLELHNEDLIINNIKLIIQWYIKNQFKCNIEIYSADWLTTPLAESIFNIFYDAFKDSDYKPARIFCPDNMQFLKDNMLTKKVESYIQLMKDINIDLILSASIDGKYCDQYRTSNDDNFYHNLKNFLEKHHYLLHPMISAQNINNQIANFSWMLEHFGPTLTYNSTFLEIRNQDWDSQSIQHLLQFCDYLVDTTFDLLNHDKIKMLEWIFEIDNKNKNITFNNTSYLPIRLPLNNFTSNIDNISCSFHNALTIRAGDLSIAPCHRLFYPTLDMGKFNVVNNEIIDFNPTNVSLLAGHLYMKRSCMPICEHCGLVGVCPGHCLGSSYEEYKNMMIPQMEVCQMYRTKIAFLIYKYNTLGLFEELPKIQHYFSKENYHYLTDLIESFLQGVN